MFQNRSLRTAIICCLSSYALAACESSTGVSNQPEVKLGSIRIVTITSGDDQDADGYTLDFIDGQVGISLPTNGNRTVAKIDSGERVIRLRGVSGNCSIDGPNPRSVVVTPGATVDVSFKINCVPGATLEVSAVIQGDSNPGSYFADVFRTGDESSTRVELSPDKPGALSKLGAGDYSIRLSAHPRDCEAVGPNPQIVSITAGSAIKIRFDVTCLAIPRLAFVGYVNGHTQIQLAESEAQLTQLTFGNSNNSEPAWSPDGKRIVFVSDRDGNAELYLMDADGRNQTRITNDAKTDYMPSWSPNGDRIAFVSDRDGFTEIYTINTDGSGIVQLTSDGYDNFDPSWSPDGSMIISVSTRNAEAGNGIWVMNSDGSGKVRIYASAQQSHHPVLSPDGTTLAFDRTTFDNAGGSVLGVFTMSLDGSNLINISGTVSFANTPSWSPDGKRLAYAVEDNCDWYYCYDFVRVLSKEGAPSGWSWADVTQPAWRPR